MSLVFADTVGLVALWNRSDQWHAAATRAYEAMRSRSSTLITTSFILLECGNNVARTSLREDVDDLREWMQESKTLVWPSQEDWTLAWQAYRRGEADQAGVVDHVSFIVMRRLGITEVFSNDHHFRAAGFQTLFN